MKHEYSPEILKECDIRGITDNNLFSADAYHLGRSFGTVLIRLGLKKCTVGQDGRLTSDALRKEAVRGLNESGVDVIYLGIVPTPMVYFGSDLLKTGAGLMVTASHNPPEYNGFKFITDRGSFHGRNILELARLSGTGDYEKGEGDCRERDISSEYISYLHSFLRNPDTKELKIIWDPGNGAVAAVMEPFLKDLPGEHTIICGEVDGTFPSHHPDPCLPSNMSQLKEKVLEVKADLGIGFDGDGDRLGVIDGKGRLLYGDQLLVILAGDYLRENPGAEVMSEVKASRFFYKEIEAMGGKPVMWKVGHTNQKEKMIADKIGLAGETSGHIFFGENRGFDDALFASIKLINCLSVSNNSLSEISETFPRYADSGEIRIILDEGRRLEVLEEIRKRLKDSGSPFIDIDGIRAEKEKGFWSIRSSNTQPHLTIRCEADNAEFLEEYFSELKAQLALSGIKDEAFIAH